MKKIIDVTTVKFVFVGIINTIVGTSVMFFCYNFLNMGYWKASALNYIIGSVVSYFLNKYFTFKSHKKSFKEIVRFVINISICYLLAYGMAKPAAMYIMSMYSRKIQENVAMFVGMGLFVIFNYCGQKFWVFTQESDQNS